jgi:SAM-dependent methyltransferase
MRCLVDLRVLVLRDPSANAPDLALDLLNQRTTSHVLPVTVQTLPVTLARVAKRLALGQDDVLVLYNLPAPVRWGMRLLAGLGRRPVLTVRAVSGPALLRAIARAARRPPKAAEQIPLRLDVGCGSQLRAGFVGLDARRTPATAIVADARALAVQRQVADEVYASCLLEHFDDPHTVLREIHRVLRPDGQAVLRLPNLGTYSSHLDTTHRFLADLALWRRILEGYFEEVRVIPVGTKYRDNLWLVRVNWILVYIFKWYELAQGWDYVCRRPKLSPSVAYTGWWEE